MFVTQTDLYPKGKYLQAVTDMHWINKLEQLLQIVLIKWIALKIRTLYWIVQKVNFNLKSNKK